MPLAVRHKLVLLSALILVGVSFGFLALNLWLARRWVEDDLRGRVVSFARVLAATISSRQEFEGGSALQHQVGEILEARREDLVQLDVLSFSPDGSTIVATAGGTRRLPFTRADTRTVQRGGTVARSGEDGLYHDVLAPVSLDGAVVGAVAARFSSAPARRLAGRIRTEGLLLTGASVAMMGVLMSLAVRYVVDRPVRSFLEAIRRIEGGDQGATVAVDTTDEFGVLSRHFNDLMLRIRRFSDELRIRVDQATGEVDRRYREVQQLNGLLFELQRRLTHAERLAVSGRLMAEVAHEVGTPLHSVAGHLELLRRDLPAGLLASDPGRRLGIIEAQVARVIEIIAQLLDLTRPPLREAGRVDLNGLVGEMADLVRPGVAAAGLHLEVATDPGLPEVTGHADQLQQVVLNLLTNAVDATPPGGQVTVRTRVLPSREEVELSIGDTGPGIPVPDRERVFEPFFSTKHQGRGTGLGLFISAQIVRDHKGRIEVAGQEGAGTTMTVRLPAAGAAA